MPSVSIRYLYHSGFAVETASHLFIFDYYLDTPRGCGPDQGVVSPSMLQGRDVVVFVSHSHGDHYNPAIFQWRKGNPQIRYILADEIATKEDVLSVKAGKTYPLGGLEVRTLDSTDLGVAFLVKADGLCLGITPGTSTGGTGTTATGGSQSRDGPPVSTTDRLLKGGIH